MPDLGGQRILLSRSRGRRLHRLYHPYGRLCIGRHAGFAGLQELRFFFVGSLKITTAWRGTAWRGVACLDADKGWSFPMWRRRRVSNSVKLA